MIELLAVLAIVAIVALVISAPLRRAAARGEPDPGRDEATIAELEAERDAKYREIRDAELDFRTGKLTRADYHALDRGLRAEAIEILRSLDSALGEEPERSPTRRGAEP